MKNYVYLFLFCLFTGSQLYGQSTCLTTGTIPFGFDNGDANSWSVNLYQPSHIGSSGPQTALSFNIVSAGRSNEIMEGVKIFMRHSNLASYPSSGSAGYPGTAGFTQVFNGDIPINVVGKVTLTLNGNFNYDGVSNVEILFINDQNKSYSRGITFQRTAQNTGGPTLAIERSGSTWSGITGPSFASRRPYTLVINDMDCQTPWSDGGPLPVTLTRFRTEENERSVILSWETTDEKDFSHFDIQRSIDAVNFETLGTVSATGENGAKTRYTFRDLSASSLQSVAYYRLKMVDSDNTFVYSSLESIALSGPANISAMIYPNPSSSGKSAILSMGGIANEKFDVLVHNQSGTEQPVTTAILPDGKISLDTSTLYPGIYHVTAKSKTGTFTRTLVVR